MIISWVVILGPVGFALLCVLTYAMVLLKSNLALGIVCCLLLFSPLLFMAVWVPLIGASVVMERSAEREVCARDRDTLIGANMRSVRQDLSSCHFRHESHGPSVAISISRACGRLPDLTFFAITFT